MLNDFMFNIKDFNEKCHIPFLFIELMDEPNF